ncbi:MAG: hypothetical protein IT184_04430 [Acidobacteria bacterium]|nr:hypothetical protein [Acidobacteriota bacterium]
MPTRGLPESQGRETRILLLIVAVSIALLLLLARLRYPAADLPVIAPTQVPLVDLTAPRGFDDLGQRLSSLLAAVSPRMLTIELEPAATPAARRRPADVQTQLATAVRVKPDLAVVHVPRGLHPRAAADTGVHVLAADEARELALLHVPPNLDTSASQPAEPFTGMAYVALVAAMRGGPTVQPVYVGRVAPLEGGRWPGALDLGPLVGLDAGTAYAMFSLDGRFLGLLIPAAGTATLVPAQALQEAGAALASGGASTQ